MLSLRSAHNVCLLALFLCIGLAGQAGAFAPSVTVRKIAIEGDSTVFHFDGYFGEFDLVHEERITFGLINENGYYDIFEEVPAGWELASIMVETNKPGDTSIINLAEGKVSLDIDPFETMTVTFTNITPEPATLSLLAAGGLVMFRRKRVARS